MRDGFLVVVVVAVVVVVKWGLGWSCGRIWLFQALLGLNFMVLVNISAVLIIVCKQTHTKRKGEST